MTTAAAACPRCGTEIEAGSRFCPSCGTEVTDAQSHAKTAMLSMADLEAQVLDLLMHETMGQFEVLQELGRGGMAMVYLAHDISLNRKVAIKVMAPSLGADPDMATRFVREAQTAASLSHPNIIPVYAVKQTEDLSYFVMKFISGRPLDSLMEETGPMSADMAKTILCQVAAGLGYGHKKGIVHRDVKPGNIMLDEDGWAIVTDFGIAKVEEASSLTQTGAAIGTPAYMSPEQLAASDVTGASDQYSLGVLAYEMMCGKKPFEGDSVVSIMYGHVHEEPPPFLDQYPNCTWELHEVIMQMLAKRPEDRFESMDAAISAIGGGQLAPDDPVRQSIMTLATQGMSAQMLEKIHTPRSPVPFNSGKVTRSRTATSPSAKTVLTDPDAAAALPEGKKGGKKAFAIAGTVVAVAAVATAVVLTRPGGESTEGPANLDRPNVPVETPPALPTTPQGAASVALEPASAGVQVGQTVSVTINSTDADGNPVPVPGASWFSGNTSVATVTTAGVVTGMGAGSALISAVVGSDTATMSVIVRAPAPSGPDRPSGPEPVASVSVVPNAGDIFVGGTLRLNATTLDGNRRTLNGRQVQWISSNPSVANVTADGLVTAVSVGRATISATSEGRNADVQVVVSAVPVERVSVSLGSTSVDVGGSTTALADLQASDGSSLRGRTVRWSTSDSRIARVGDNGSITGVSAGVATITATSEGRTGSATITVVANEVVTPAVDPRVKIEEAIQTYARALESEDISRIRLIYPRISSDEENNWRTAWDAWSDFTVSLNADDVQINGNSARVAVSGTYAYRSRSGNDQLPVDIQLTLEKRGEDWVITSVR